MTWLTCTCCISKSVELQKVFTSKIALFLPQYFSDFLRLRASSDKTAIPSSALLLKLDVTRLFKYPYVSEEEQNYAFV